VDRKAISLSSLVTKSTGSEGAAKGVISFCIKAETIYSETSVTFLNTNVDLSYDLTQNVFEVTDNTIVENNIEETSTTVSTNYGVRAFRCTKSTYDEDTTNAVIQQGSLVAICLKPKANSSAAVNINNFDMKFEQDGVFVLPHPASIGTEGPEKSSMSEITKENQTYRVVSRLVTQLFDGGASFNVRGNAYLVFKEERNLLASSSKALRSVQRSAENVAGESSFGMNVQIEKNFEVYENKTSNSVSFLSVIGATLALVIGFTLYKKLG